ncbi:HTH domain-containing protein [Candidatus Nomurabacteria bacterium]|nr:HTH domain-containing protein [Candidatus Nomurabacteria bacterium]
MILDSVETKIITILFQATTPLKVSSLAKETNISRTALYRPLESLERKGLVIRSKSETGDLFSSISFEEYKKWKIEQIKQLEDSLGQLDNFALNKKDVLTKPEVRYFTGNSAVKNLYHDSWRNNKRGIIYAITDYDKAYETMGDFMETEYFPERINHNIHVKSILARSKKGVDDTQRERDLLREMKFVEGLNDLGIELNIYSNRISLIQFNQKNPVGVLIINQIIADSFKKIFEVIWNEK